MPYQVFVLKDGYSFIDDKGHMRANASCTLILGPKNIIIDTLTAWDKDVILQSLSSHSLMPSDIHYVIGTHGHSDHIGNLNLFTEATHIVGFCVHRADLFYIHPFECGEPYKIDDDIEVIPTPGHTLSDVSLVVRNVAGLGTVVVAGDLFEKQEDLEDAKIWKELAFSENPALQEQNRFKVLQLADYIVPGHGKMFKVTQDMKKQPAGIVQELHI